MSKRDKGTEEIRCRFHRKDSIAGIKPDTLERLASILQLSKCQVVHLALARLAAETLISKYEPDDGPLTKKQIEAIRKIEADPQSFKPTKKLF